MAARNHKVGRWHITSRVVAAMVVGLIVANSIGAFLSLALPGDLIHNVMSFMVLGFVIHTAIILWVFSVKRLRTVWWGLLSTLAVTAAGTFVLVMVSAAH
ncbi:MAG: hypothetical protein AAF385_07500 [Pseudomonadota bacterium]